MNDDITARAVEQLCATRRGGAAIEPLPTPPVTEREAYALQRAVHLQLCQQVRGALVGHKIGCTTPVMQSYLNIGHPCAGGILEATVYQSRRSYTVNLTPSPSGNAKLYFSDRVVTHSGHKAGTTKQDCESIYSRCFLTLSRRSGADYYSNQMDAMNPPSTYSN